MTALTSSGRLRLGAFAATLILASSASYVAAAGDSGPQFFDSNVLIPKVVVKGFPFVAKIMITNTSPHMLPVKVFDFANGGGFSDFSVTFSRDTSEIARFERPPVSFFMEPTEAVRQNPAKAAWLKPGESIEMWFDINQATYLATSFTKGVLEQAQPDYPIGESSVTINFGGDIGPVDAGVVSVREPTSAESDFLDFVRARARTDRLFLKTLLLDVGELPGHSDLPADTNELMSVMMALKSCATCIREDDAPLDQRTVISSLVFRELHEVIQIECRCAWSQSIEPIQAGEPRSQGIDTLLMNGGGPVGSLRNELRK